MTIPRVNDSYVSCSHVASHSHTDHTRNQSTRVIQNSGESRCDVSRPWLWRHMKCMTLKQRRDEDHQRHSREGSHDTCRSVVLTATWRRSGACSTWKTSGNRISRSYTWRTSCSVTLCHDCTSCLRVKHYCLTKLLNRMSAA